MKPIIVLVLLSSIILTGCQDGNSNQPISESPQIKQQESDPNALSRLTEVDVIEVPNSDPIKNLERFYNFLEKFNQKEPDEIQIVSFTTEGDRIYQNVQFDGEVVNSIIDSSRDQYGSGGIRKAACTEMKIEESDERTDYLLEGCENQEEVLLLVVWK